MPNILVITLLAVLYGADEFTEVEEFGLAKQDWQETFLNLPEGIPAHDTFGRVFSLLDPEHLADSLTDWASTLAKATDQFGASEFLCLDGKTLRGSYNKSSKLKPLPVVSAWASESGVANAF